MLNNNFVSSVIGVHFYKSLKNYLSVVCCFKQNVLTNMHTFNSRKFCSFRFVSHSFHFISKLFYSDFFVLTADAQMTIDHQGEVRSKTNEKGFQFFFLFFIFFLCCIMRSCQLRELLFKLWPKHLSFESRHAEQVFYERIQFKK